MREPVRVMETRQSFLTFIRLQQLLSCQVTPSSAHCQSLNGIFGGILPCSLGKQKKQEPGHVCKLSLYINVMLCMK